MQIQAYNSLSGHTETVFLNDFSYDDFLDILSAGNRSFSYAGNTYSLTVNTDTLEIQGSGSVATINDIDDVINLLSLAGFDNFNFRSLPLFMTSSYTTPTAFTYHKDSNMTPYYLGVNVVLPNDTFAYFTPYSTGHSNSVVSAYSTSLGGFCAGCFATFYHSQNDIYYYGAVAISALTIRLCINPNLSSNTFISPSVDPGGRGFKPIKDIAKFPTGGGSVSSKNPIYATDILTQPGAPDESAASISGTGFLNVYDITKENLANVGACLFGATLSGFLTNLLINPLDFIVSLIIMPYTPNIGGSSTIKLGRYLCDTTSPTGLGFNATGLPLTSQYRTLDFGTLNVAEAWQSFLDYDASSFSLYLPFIGTVDIPVGEVMAGSINVQYTLDYFTGTCVANVLCTKNAELSSGRSVPQASQHSYQGNCAIQIPLANVSYGNLIGSLIQAGASGLKGDVAGAVGSTIDAFRPSVQTKGTISANAGYCSKLKPYITITRPIAVEPDSYQETSGYPCYITSTLGECSDLCVCDDINLSNVSGATENELNRIKQLCKEGVYV